MLQTTGDLQSILENILGSKNVYFQPPENLRLKYPCIVYNLSRKEIKRANNGNYIKKDRYQITVIDEDPDSEIPDRLLELPFSSFDTSYRSENLNHFVISIYFKGGRRYE